MKRGAETVGGWGQLYKLLDQVLPVNPIASLSIKAPVTENPTANGHLHKEKY
jgi:hypothetical protein